MNTDLRLLKFNVIAVLMGNIAYDEESSVIFFSGQSEKLGSKPRC